MEIIKVIDKDRCNEILNKYKASYYYDYDKDCFIDDNQDINPPQSLKPKKNKKNLFNEAKNAGSKVLHKIKKNGNLCSTKKAKDVRDAYKKAYDKRILRPYGNLTATKNKKDAYEIAENLDVKICPYCNINYIYIVEIDKKNKRLVSRPDFDHFFSKSKHPEFQLQLLNLVPSCQVCNRTIKGDKEFDVNNNLNPYELSFDKIKYFDIKFKSDDAFILSILASKMPEDCFDIIFRSRPNISWEERKKANGNIKDFELYARYQNHKDVVIDLFKKRRAFYNARITEVASTTDESDNQLYAAMFSDYNCDINHTSLGKLKRDIINKYIKY